MVVYYEAWLSEEADKPRGGFEAGEEGRPGTGIDVLVAKILAYYIDMDRESPPEIARVVKHEDDEEFLLHQEIVDTLNDLLAVKFFDAQKDAADEAEHIREISSPEKTGRI